jgi:hypothetical protein
MARGWESKAVADQIEEGNSRQSQVLPDNNSPEERVRQDRLRSLQLTRSRLLQQLERAKHSAHRQVLLNGLKAIEKEIEEISSTSPGT